MASFRIRPLTVGLALLAIVLIAVGVVYFTTSAADLPGFLPGHAAHSAKHHYKHGFAMITLALLALGAAWFTTAPDRPTEPS